ncbi:MAG: ParA family protein [Oligoflexales bacterium]|nr:ParA family protein [Oligoflexales bacterium]
MGRVIAISNQKGGVGKTTTAINLSASLAVGEKKVLLIDLDPQSNTTSGLGIFPQSFDDGIYEVLTDNIPLKNTILRTELECLDVVPACQDLIGVEIELLNELGRETRLKEVLEGVQRCYDFIILDCPPALGLLTINALTAAHGVLIPLQCEYYAMEGVSQLLKTIALIHKRLNQGLEIEGILLTMYDRRNNLCTQVEQEARKHFPNEIFSTMIPRNVKLSEAPSHGKPILLYDVNSSGSQAYLQLGEEVLKRTQEANLDKNAGSCPSSKTQRLEKTEFVEG